MSNLEKCEGCDQHRVLTPFGNDEVLLCSPCWDSAYFHREKKPGECGIDACRICYEPEEGA